MAIRWPLLVRRTHKWLALVVGVQALLWALTGMYMVAVHIDIIHGDHLVRPAPERAVAVASLLDPVAVAALLDGSSEITMDRVRRMEAIQGVLALTDRRLLTRTPGAAGWATTIGMCIRVRL